MTATVFLQSLKDEQPPTGNPILAALWHDYNGNWHKAHALVQDLTSREAAHLHAYLHRKEGDNSNALYWYHRAGEPMPAVSLEEEWSALLSRYTLAG